MEFSYPPETRDIVASVKPARIVWPHVQEKLGLILYFVVANLILPDLELNQVVWVGLSGTMRGSPVAIVAVLHKSGLTLAFYQ